MANQQNQQGQQNQQRSTEEQTRENPNGEISRSEDLLPAGQADNTADGRFEVAEEVNLDQQSDSTRRVGQTPEGIATEGLADSLKSGSSGGKGA
jgi:actin-related protein